MESANQLTSALIDHFKDGDLLYGVESERIKIRKFLTNKNIFHCTIDVINRLIIFPSIYKKELTFEYNENILSAPPLKYFADGFLQYMQAEFNSNEQLKTIFTGFLNEENEDALVRYNCQAAVRYVLSPGNDSTIIHFELEGIDLANVFTKEGMDNECFTTSELREVVRVLEKDELALFNKIKFYQKGNLLSLQDFKALIKLHRGDRDLYLSPIKKTIENNSVKEKRELKKKSLKRRIEEIVVPPRELRGAKRNILLALTDNNEEGEEHLISPDILLESISEPEVKKMRKENTP